MTNDAKLGLVIGIGVVILIAIVFFHRDPALARAVPDTRAPAQAQVQAGRMGIPPASVPLVPPRTQIRAMPIATDPPALPER